MKCFYKGSNCKNVYNSQKTIPSLGISLATVETQFLLYLTSPEMINLLYKNITIVII